MLEVVKEDEHDRRLKDFIIGCREKVPCAECYSYVGCLKTRAYFLKGWIFNPQNKYYLDPEGKIVKRLQ